MTFRRRGAHWPAALTVTAALMLGACSASASGNRPGAANGGGVTPTGQRGGGSTVSSTGNSPHSGRSGHSARPSLVPLPPPARLAPFSSPALAGEGVWHAAARRVDGRVALYETLLRPPGSSLEAGVAWMDTRLLRAQLYSGSLSPGGGPWKFTAPITRSEARTLVAAFNGGFKFPSAEGGYYSEGKLVFPLRVGGASIVIYKNGNVTVADWGRDARMSSQVAAVRQNLTLLVDAGKPVPGLSPTDNYVWGPTLGGLPNVWRAGLGVTANGALVYVSGPSLDVPQLADLLVRAGCVRAMTVDINPEWTVLASYDPPTPTGLASAANGQDLLPGMAQTPGTFFESWWARDFITMSAR